MTPSSPSSASINTLALLADLAEAGVAVRVLLADPDSVHVLTERAARARLAGRGRVDRVWEIERSLGYLQPLISHPKVEVLLFTAARPYAIVRADDHMLVRMHVWGAAPDTEPVLELERRTDTGLFDRLVEHLELVRTYASVPAPTDPEVYPDPDQNPDRYRPQPLGPDRRYASAFTAAPASAQDQDQDQDQEPGMGTSPSSAPASSRRRRR